MGIYVPKSRCEYEAPRSAADISTIIVLINVHLNLHGPLACRLYQDATAAAAFEPPSAESAAEHLKHRGAASLRVIISESMQLHSSFIAGNYTAQYVYQGALASVDRLPVK